jgi:hypothetical protein
MPCVAKVLLRGVLSQTPGNFLAENTLNLSLKQDARMGALPLTITDGPLSREPVPGVPTLTKENRSLCHHECNPLAVYRLDMS